MTHFETANQYIENVLDGTVLACEYVKQACQRQKDDLNNPELPFSFNLDKAEHICNFTELLTHIKGKWAGQHIKLEPWQVFILTTVFGWVDAEGNRRYKTVYAEIPRKNAKSTISSAVALYCMGLENEGGAEVYSAATTRDQARIVFQDAKYMVEKSQGLQSKGFKTSAHAVYQESTASSFKALSRDQGGNLDGLNIHCAIIDELHAHKTRDVWDVIETGTGARSQPLLWAITTAGFNRAGICYEQRSYGLKILNQSVKDEEYFAVIYTTDEDDDWTDESSWIKANPNWGVSVNPDDIRRKARKAMEMAAAQNNFLTKHLNNWVNADTAWMDMRAWDKCGKDIAIEDFTGKPCWIGVDLASKTDIASAALLFKEDDRYTLFVKNYLNEDAAEDGRNSQYSGWAIDNHLTLTPGNITDFAYIEDDIRKFAAAFDVQEVIFDPWQASYIMQRLQDEGLNAVEYRQTVQNMSSPMKELEAMVMQKQLTHDKNPVMSWMVSNTVCHIDAKENIYPRKEFHENKIDGVVATIMAIGRAMTEETEQMPGVAVW